MDNNQVQTAPQQPVMQAPDPTVPRKSNSLVMVLGGFVLLGLGLLGGYFLFGNKQVVKKTNINATVSPTSTLSEVSPTISEANSNLTASWITNTETTPKFTIKYPSDWVEKEFTPGTPNLGYGTNSTVVKNEHPFLISDKTVFFTSKVHDKKDSAGNIDNVGVYVQVYKGSKATTVKEFANKYLDGLIKLNSDSETSSRVYSEKTYNGKNMVAVTTTTAAPGGEAKLTYYFYLDTSKSIVFFQYGLEGNYIEDMLTTFNSL